MLNDAHDSALSLHRGVELAASTGARKRPRKYRRIPTWRKANGNHSLRSATHLSEIRGRPWQAQCNNERRSIAMSKTQVSLRTRPRPQRTTFHRRPRDIQRCTSRCGFRRSKAANSCRVGQSRLQTTVSAQRTVCIGLILQIAKVQSTRKDAKSTARARLQRKSPRSASQAKCFGKDLLPSAEPFRFKVLKKQDRFSAPEIPTAKKVWW